VTRLPWALEARVAALVAEHRRELAAELLREQARERLAYLTQVVRLAAMERAARQALVGARVVTRERIEELIGEGPVPMFAVVREAERLAMASMTYRGMVADWTCDNGRRVGDEGSPDT